MADLRIIVVDDKWSPRHEVIRTEKTISGETIEDCFEQFSNAKRHLRYNNDRDMYVAPEFEEAYDKWYGSLSYGKKIDLYYGNGTVD